MEELSPCCTRVEEQDTEDSPAKAGRPPSSRLLSSSPVADYSYDNHEFERRKAAAAAIAAKENAKTPGQGKQSTSLWNKDWTFGFLDPSWLTM